jgi:hypothetical protein
MARAGRSQTRRMLLRAARHWYRVPYQRTACQPWLRPLAMAAAEAVGGLSPAEQRHVVTAFLVAHAEASGPRVLLMRRSQSVRCVGSLVQAAATAD